MTGAERSRTDLGASGYFSAKRPNKEECPMKMLMTTAAVIASLAFASTSAMAGSFWFSARKDKWFDQLK